MAEIKKIEINSKIKILDSVRAGAAIAVFMFHAGFLLTYPSGGIISLQRLAYFSGTVGVSIFFVLSGWLLFYQLYKTNEPLDAAKLKNYAKKRALRLLPLYYFSLFFIVIFLRQDILFAADGLRSIFYNLIFIRGIKDASGAGGTIPINPVYWSLVVEMHFYILLPIFYYIFYKYKKISLFFLVACLGIIYRIFLVFVIKTPTMQMLRFTPANFDFFAFGMLGAYLYIHRGKWANYIGNGWVQLASLAAFILFINFYDLDFLPTTAYIFAPVFLGLVTVFAMMSFLFNSESLMSKLATSSPVLFIGKISFGIYIWHTIVIGKVYTMPMPDNAKFPLIVILTLIISIITYYLIEAPFLKFKEKRLTI